MAEEAGKKEQAFRQAQNWAGQAEQANWKAGKADQAGGSDQSSTQAGMHCRRAGQGRQVGREGLAGFRQALRTEHISRQAFRAGREAGHGRSGTHSGRKARQIRQAGQTRHSGQRR
jgi:hypothetical protein